MRSMLSRKPQYIPLHRLHTSNGSAPKKIVIFGGNGYVGQYVANRALQLGLEVTSISRTGQPTHPIDGYMPGWEEQVKWEIGDVLDFSPSVRWKEVLIAKDGVISCIGAFGKNEFAEKLNGHANVNIAKLSSEAGVKNFVYVSADGDNVPSFFLRGYFDGKRLADRAVASYFKSAGMILRPGFVYGTRKVGSVSLPLHLIGKPLEWFLCATGLSKLKVLSAAVPISVQDVAIAAVAGATGEDMMRLVRGGSSQEGTAATAATTTSETSRVEGGGGAVVECRHDDIVAIRNRLLLRE